VLIVDSSAVADIALRTATASLLRATMVPAVLSTALRRSEPRAEHDHLRFYAELASAQDPELSFPAPTSEPRISSRPANPIAEWMAKGIDRPPQLFQQAGSQRRRVAAGSVVSP